MMSLLGINRIFEVLPRLGYVSSGICQTLAMLQNKLAHASSIRGYL